ncbi:hypothetical protein FHQ18_09105 [Deferribacter autotrophicus]|uniref:Uncharacterized protein n=1 Tax=Deferribacter autotrophicus TaxID=500465 RepID=A0A5A8F211_9BACT|nr:TrbI F-type domain-containing protein [Deferribacter autotrophicus]KAA0257490.1 hypothetical protein FHQ18_09105 [Deferribacter autotrophicus]
MSKEKENAISNPKIQKKNKINYFAVVIIVLLVTVIVQIVTAQIFSKAIIKRNFVSVDTSKIIEIERIELAKKAKSITDSKQLFAEFEKFIEDLKSTIDSMSKSLNVIVLEKGAVVSSDIYDLTDVVIKRMNKKGYKLDLDNLQKLPKIEVNGDKK